ncbi:hypothetical protein, partial [Burkholderia cepacia]|uniref:hypothetical protein n=1 Tax=Burkholderia cepacia TaxID=292 RepID=UPI001C9355E9
MADCLYDIAPTPPERFRDDARFDRAEARTGHALVTVIDNALKKPLDARRSARSRQARRRTCRR